MKSAFKNHLKSLEILKNADFNKTDFCGNSPLYMAVVSSNVEAVKYLIGKNVRQEENGLGLNLLDAARLVLLGGKTLPVSKNALEVKNIKRKK